MPNRTDRERRSHAKSRFGCDQCKARRVKCDEIRPLCSNCTRRKEPCSYENPTLRPSLGASGPGQTGYAQQRQAHTKELELMHQYSISTYESISIQAPSVHNALAVMPRLGLEHPFLLDALFAFTSLHIAYLKPGEAQERIVEASRYQSQALAYCRQQLPILSAAECQAMFHCSAALGMLALAVRAVDSTTRTSLRPTETAHQLAHLWRGTIYVLRAAADLVDADTYATLFPPYGCKHNNLEMLSPRAEEFFELLRRRANECGHRKPKTPPQDANLMCAAPDINTAGEHEPGTEYIAAIDLLQEVFVVHRDEPNRILAWLLFVGSPFMDALSNQEPLASAIVLLWSVTFRELESNWWATGYRKQLVDELVPLVSEIDPNFAELAAWVQRQT